jgi:hypothetical protein
MNSERRPGWTDENGKDGRTHVRKNMNILSRYTAVQMTSMNEQKSEKVDIFKAHTDVQNRKYDR